MPQFNTSVLNRFASKVAQADSGCLEWQSHLHRDGYGKFYMNGKTVQAHRAAYMINVGEIPNGMWVLHRCDNRLCVNTDHLYLGDAKQNVRDKVERCAWWGNMRVSFDTIQEIRRLYATKEYSQQKLADMFGVHQTQVSKYVRHTQRTIK